MRAALRAMEPPPAVAQALEEYLALAADALRNRED
jgi:hypothetical protein